ncbi:uncharacterized protein LOC111261786 isoform X2 [Varroa jacobsoni]|uniref:uncharacterized protein LOC111261786 isoform X2 n=1 Tax=Varroa jacobsoni TaxID=62625 RepID=UPI000BF65C26|nr:uncharacterized protein LOC111261786 isoform X2 [Varroa jacobsoni]
MGNRGGPWRGVAALLSASKKGFQRCATSVWLPMRFRRQYSLLLSKAAITLCFTYLIWYQIRDPAPSADAVSDTLPRAFARLRKNNGSVWVIEPSTRAQAPRSEASSYVRSYVAELNRMQTIYNEDVYGPLAEHDVVIVVQVHNRWTYLEALVDSLRAVPNINRTLLIFSHDFYDANGVIEELPKIVTFTKMMQIFYPSSIQLEPNRFPGDDPKDCPRDATKSIAKKLGCQNAAYPDLYGHYREGKFCQTKHHWWWKANRVMDALNATAQHNGPFMFLEEDHYVTPDVLHVLRRMETAQPKACPECRIFVMGTYLKSFNYRQLGSTVDILKWASSRHNMGMVLYRELWRDVRDRCARTFCTYDDYNWDWSLYRVSMSCFEKPLHAMVVRTTRVFHVGECGVHHKGSSGKPTGLSPSFDFLILPDLHRVVCIAGLALSIVSLLVLRTRGRPTSSTLPADNNPDVTRSPVLVFMRHTAVATALTFLFQHLFIDIHYFIGRYILSALQGPLCHASVHLEFSSAIVHFFLAGLFASLQYLCALHGSSRWTRFFRKRFDRLCEWVWCLALIIALPVCWYTGSHAGMCFDDGMEHLYGYRFVFVDILTSVWLLTPLVLHIRWLRRTTSFASALRTLWRANRLSTYYAAKWTFWALPLCLLADYSWHHNHVNVLLFAYDGYLLSYAIDVIFFAFFVEEFRELLRATLPWLPIGRAISEGTRTVSPLSSTSSLSNLSGGRDLEADLEQNGDDNDENELLNQRLEQHEALYNQQQQQQAQHHETSTPNVNNVLSSSTTPIEQLTLVQI